MGKSTGKMMTWRELIASLLLVETWYAKTDLSETMDNNANGSKYNGKLRGWSENGRLLSWGHERRTLCYWYLSALNRHSVVCIYEFLGRLAKLLLMSVERSLSRNFCLWSNSRQMTPLAVCPIERCRVSRNAVLYPTVSATVNNEQQGDMLTSQTTTVLGAHLTRVWKSWPRATWSYRNFNR